MANQFILRRADMKDIDALSQLCQRTIRETFLEDFSISYPKNDLEFYLRSSASPEYFANKITDPQRAVWVIEDKIINELVAYAIAGSCDIDDIPHPDVQTNKDGTLNRLYVRRDRQNYGFGRQLMNVILPWIEEHYPDRPIWLTVFSGNFKAQKFYAHYDFNKVGEFDYSIGDSKDHEFIMKRQTHG